MRLFVTGASGFIGSAVVPQLLAAGHQVLGLARSEDSARKVTALGAQAHRGDLNDLKSLEAGARETDGVIHLGFIHDFANFAASLQTDRVAIDTLGKVLEGTNKSLVIASGLLGLDPGKTVTEDFASGKSQNPRMLTAAHAETFGKRGVRVSFVRLSPTVHDQGDHGFVHTLATLARQKGFVGYPGDGQNHWNAVHRQDAAQLFKLAAEKAAPGAVLHAVAEEAITTRAIAEALGKAMKLPAQSVSPEKVAEHFGWIGMFFSMDQAASSKATQERYQWKPTHPTLLADIEAGYYTV